VRTYVLNDAYNSQRTRGTVVIVVVDVADHSFSTVNRARCRRCHDRTVSPCSQIPEASQPPLQPSSPLFLISFPLSAAHRCSLRKDFFFLNDVFKFLLLLHDTIHVHLLLRVNESRVHPTSNTFDIYTYMVHRYTHTHSHRHMKHTQTYTTYVIIL